MHAQQFGLHGGVGLGHFNHLGQHFTGTFLLQGVRQRGLGGGGAGFALWRHHRRAGHQHLAGQAGAPGQRQGGLVLAGQASFGIDAFAVPAQPRSWRVVQLNAVGRLTALDAPGRCEHGTFLRGLELRDIGHEGFAACQDLWLEVQAQVCIRERAEQGRVGGSHSGISPQPRCP